MNWEETEIDLGKLVQNTRINFYFTSAKPLSIINIKAGCGSCTKVGEYKDGKLPVTFKTGFIPVHLKKQGYYNVRKKVIVTYENGEKEILTFIATII